MGEREVGRYWSTEEERKISTLWKVKGEQKKIPEMRSTCKSHTDVKVEKASAVSRKRAAGNPGGKPTNVKTFAARGGLISKERRAGAAVRGFDFKGVF